MANLADKTPKLTDMPFWRDGDANWQLSQRQIAEIAQGFECE
jgi:hypothetical protein